MKKTSLFILLGAAVLVPALFLSPAINAQLAGTMSERPDGPCDIYAAGGAPCAAAHSTTRALYKDYNGPLYQVVRQSDGQKLDIGVTQPRRGDAGGYADAAAQDSFCADTYCFISIIYDQSPQGNHLIQAPHSGIQGAAMGGMDNIPLADLEPVSLNGHKVYGTFIIPGMGMRWNDATGTAVDDLAEGMYWVINGNHYSDGCCFDYGNAEIDSRDDGDGTMETTYFGIKNKWYYGPDPGPWLMTDQENNLVGCVNESPDDKYCETLASINWRFATQMVDGAPHRWRNMAGNSQEGGLEMIYDGGRIKNDRSSYDPMRKQGAILLGNGGDNGNVSSGTFYEGAMTKAGTFPSEETNQAVQANIVNAKYNVATLQVGAANRIEAPDGVQTWAPNSTRHVTVKFTNTIGEAVVGLTLTVVPPKGWKYNVLGSTDKVKSFRYIAPDESVYVTFAVRSSSEEFNGDINVKANWNSFGKTWSETAHSKIRNVYPLKINEFRIADNKGNATNAFIELYNDSDSDIDVSGWTITQHPKNVPYTSSILLPSGTKVSAKGFFLLGLANSGLAVGASKGEEVIYVRDLKGMSVGDEIQIGTGANAEIRKISEIVNTIENTARPVNAPGTPTFIFQPLPNGPDDLMYETFPAGVKNIPVNSVANFQVGQKMAIGYGASYPAYGEKLEKYEVVTVTKVGMPGTQAYTSYDAKKGDRVLYVSNVRNLSPGDQILLDINSQGHGKELVTIRSVGTASSQQPSRGPMSLEQAGTGLVLTKPLKYNHSANTPFAVLGTGISFTPAARYDHKSNEPVIALTYSILLDEPLYQDHQIDDVVYDAKVRTAGYQGEVPADLLYGGPAFSPSGGNIVLRNAGGLVVDALNYGRVVDSQYSEGYHAESGKNAMGSFVTTPYITNNDGYNNPKANAVLPNLSAGRFPDGYDSDNNKYDFKVQLSFYLAADIPSGSTNVKFTSTLGLVAGQVIYIGDDTNYESAVVATVGTKGATVLTAAVKPGDRYIQVENSADFSEGQLVLINGQKADIAKIQSATAIELAAPFQFAAPEGTAFTGTGVGIVRPLKNDHKKGEAASVNIPTPGRPNVY